MNETDVCRLCANLAGPANSDKLFERSQRKLLRQIVDLTGLQLKNTKDLPQHICKACEEETFKAHRFRERCIRTQKFFAQQINQVADNKNRNASEKQKTKEQQPLAEQQVLVKVEEKKEEIVCKEEKRIPEEVAIPNQIEESYQTEILLPDIAEVLLKGEPIDSDGSDASASDGYNPLDEKEENSSCDDQSMVLEGTYVPPQEPQVNLVTDESPLNSKKKDRKKSPKKKEKRVKKIRIPKSICLKLEENFICDQCGQHFNCQKKFDYHMRRHAGDKQFQCEICPQSYFSYQSLHRHIRTHTGSRPYGCRYCDRHFMDYSSRVRHERVHTNTRPFGCSICTKSFTTNYMLKDHMVIHSGERAFKCLMCSVSFSRKTHLSTHYRSLTHKQNEEKHHKFLIQTVEGAQPDFTYDQNEILEQNQIVEQNHIIEQNQILEPVVETAPFLTQF